jgi:hypothetical protein
MNRIPTFGVILLTLLPSALAEEITIATYNIENFPDRFLGFHMDKKFPRDGREKDVDALIRAVSSSNREDQWEISQVILDKNFAPDVVAIEECCEQSDLEYFNRKWLGETYGTIIVFPGNAEPTHVIRNAMMLKKGFKVIERKDEYYKEPDTAGGNERGAKLFARGPAFLLVQSPGGYKFWVGVTHQKSKNVTGGQRIPADADIDFEKFEWDAETSAKKIEGTKWRNREAKRTHEIMQELRKQGPNDVMILGDMNDALGVNRFDSEGGGDTIAILTGPPEDGFVLATRSLADSGEFSFAGYNKKNGRHLIDHIVTTPEMKDQIREVKVFRNDFTSVASDHLPVMVKITADPPQ